MKPRSVLVVYKQISKKATPLKGVRSHLKTLDSLYQLLKAYGIPFTTAGTQQLTSEIQADLVITVGGDGTVLAASHYVTDQPVLGIKSFGEESVGFFCAATGTTMGLYLRELMQGRHRPRKLNRLKVLINNHPIHELVLNDVLIANLFPACTSKYTLTISQHRERQTSSGIWIATAAGSTAAIHAAGGRVMPMSSKGIQYLVREPYSPGYHYRLTRGMLPPRARIVIRSDMRHGTISIDGHHTQYPFPTGTVVRVERSHSPFHILWR